MLEIYIVGFIMMFLLTLHHTTDRNSEFRKDIYGNTMKLDYLDSFIFPIITSLFWFLFIFVVIADIIRNFLKG